MAGRSKSYARESCRWAPPAHAVRDGSRVSRLQPPTGSSARQRRPAASDAGCLALQRPAAEPWRARAHVVVAADEDGALQGGVRPLPRHQHRQVATAHRLVAQAGVYVAQHLLRAGGRTRAVHSCMHVWWQPARWRPCGGRRSASSAAAPARHACRSLAHREAVLQKRLELEHAGDVDRVPGVLVVGLSGAGGHRKVRGVGRPALVPASRRAAACARASTWRPPLSRLTWLMVGMRMDAEKRCRAPSKPPSSAASTGLQVALSATTGPYCCWAGPAGTERSCTSCRL